MNFDLLLFLTRKWNLHPASVFLWIYIKATRVESQPPEPDRTGPASRLQHEAAAEAEPAVRSGPVSVPRL